MFLIIPMTIGTGTAGGDGSSASVADAFQYLTFYRPTIGLGEVFTFEYGYAFK